MHITLWTLMVMLHIIQSIYLVLTNVLCTSFLMFHIRFDEICTTPYISGKRKCTWYTWAMICSYFGIAFLLFFMKIENTVYTSFQNSTLLFINGLIFDIMNIQNNQSLEFEWIPMLVSLICVNGCRFSWLRNVFYKSFQNWVNSVQQWQRNFQKMLASKFSYRGRHMEDWK